MSTAFVCQGSCLQCTLSTSYNHYLFVSKTFKGMMISCVRNSLGMQVVILSWTVGIVTQTRSHYDCQTLYYPAISQGYLKVPLFALNCLYISLINIRDGMPLEPESIFDKSFRRKWIDCLL